MTVYHIIDHAGFGTIHRLLYPLCDAYACHRVLIRKSENQFIDETEFFNIISDTSARVIVHSTGNLDMTCRKALVAFKLPEGRGFIFLHTSYEYQKTKGRGNMIDVLLELQKKYNYIVLVPSKEVAVQYCRQGITVIPVQLGIPGIRLQMQCNKYRSELSRYYGKYITTCSSEKEIYRHVKGIDLFIKLSRKYDLEKECLIAGIELPNQPIEAARFNENDFLNILYHSKAYIQLSRFESYNLTAVWAKQFRIPTLVLGVEGTWSSMGSYALTSEAELEEKLKLVIDGNYPESWLDECYQDSMDRETIECFHRSLEEILKLTNE